MEQKDDPLTLLNKPSYKTMVLKLKAPFLNTLCLPCCYTEQAQAKLYKWIPHVKGNSLDGQSGKRVLKIKENSSCIERCMLPASCRGYKNQFKAENTGKVIIHMDRQCKASFLCLARPSASVYMLKTSKTRLPQYRSEGMEPVHTLSELNEQSSPGKSKFQKVLVTEEKVPIGRVELPYSFGQIKAIIYDEQNIPILQIQGSKAQLQLCLFTSCVGPCRTSEFVIGDYSTNMVEAKGYIYKTWSNFYKVCCSSAPWYIIDFPDECDWRRKILITAAIQLIDQHYFSGWCQ
ncbi:hypothetical protein FGO68_gene5821 [Halteria grandinella]|uniref:Phospholipid scramblase n=1 Tax=Halteria grandinella TaxID=5974 RepID=A0A8J8NCM5_HALGN|nr:hypothetical protein FGO68_gene5821 [Halteria grandinella]